jgi:dCMP deaminase
MVPRDGDPLISFIDTDDKSSHTIVDEASESPDPGLLNVDSAHRGGKLPSNSFLSLESAASSPICPRFQRNGEPPLCFTSAEELLKHVTRNWRQDFVTQDLRTEQTIDMFTKRPFFMLVSIDGPISDRFRRANTLVRLCLSNALRHTFLRQAIWQECLSMRL